MKFLLVAISGYHIPMCLPIVPLKHFLTTIEREGIPMKKKEEHKAENLPEGQLSSSDLSRQSGCPSQRYLLLIQWPLPLHLN